MEKYIKSKRAALIDEKEYSYIKLKEGR